MVNILTKIGLMGVALVGVLNLQGMDTKSVGGDDVRSICSTESVDTTPEATPSTSPAVGRDFLRSPAALKVIQKLSGRYNGPLSPEVTTYPLDASVREFYTRDGRKVELSN
jgi:hypothetical protein